ncbi:MBL fold metallo-hydrolase [Paramaledivibacter caminithermalis]|uniref:RNA processing exonuclease, beta-lactamase fold, Cft2 family n=1 Tax=Paramaledivibacter caminithermalis (strain DSM 15212 / CIP 107654 / DViRD3) TaxID=1121301 RepID=A0A1M6QT81_PARC5|nr:MBL fold metallo-hydrolase [Paramaledivibacter caminithermalis]SHK23492.1 RNA processing exonuclease, beta-lactamase fold, Cft2 family [Paramaledivibacter caminithermalis DSM 15212]
MKITFCGGAKEVGASCYLINVDNKNILLDCGIRMKAGKDSLPDFRRIQELGGVDAIVISHAHLDHTGSLPIVSREYPNALIYMTHATKDLIRVLLYDSLKIMNNNEAEIPIYAEVHVQNMLSKIVCYSPQYPIQIFKDKNIRITFYNAGHIAGAALIYVQGDEGTLLYTGDISAVDQQTVTGASLPKLRPDVMIMESTYGDKLHSNRQIEEDRLIEKVRQVIEKDGKILIPAFALGRAQEIILILKRAINKNQLPKFKIYVDGMVKDINRVYKLNPNYLKKNLAKKIFKGNEIFYDENVIAVKDKDVREEIANSKDGLCVISSSGMLNGGPSLWYAEKFAGDERNFIAITGYQDEEAPGREILELIDCEEKERKIHFNDRSIPLKCGIGKYGLSAHGDKGELLGIIHKVMPRKLFLVHGEQSIIESFSRDINKEIRTQVFVPTNGDEYDISFRNPRKQLEINKGIQSLMRNDELTEDNIKVLWKHVYEAKGTNIGWLVEELIFIWSGKKAFSEENIVRFREVLNESKYFEPNSRKLFLYHPVSEEELTEDDGIMEMNEMLNLVDEIFPNEAGLYKKGARYEEKIVLLNFNFPQKAKEKYREEIKGVEDKTGWKVEINKDCNQGAAEELLYSLLPSNINIDKFSYHRDKGYFLISLDGEIKDVNELQKKFQNITGIKLMLGLEKTVAEDINLKKVNKENMMEQNKAFQTIDKEFEAKEHKIYKKSKKEIKGIPYIELSFISPQIGEKYKGIIESLEEKTGWNITIANNPNQNEIIKIIKNIFRQKEMILKKNPSIHVKEGLVKIKLSCDVLEEDKKEIIKAVKEQTGFDLILI